MRLETPRQKNPKAEPITHLPTNPAAAFLTCVLPENLQTTLPLPPLTLRHDTALVYCCGERNGAYRNGMCRLRLYWQTQGVPAPENPAVALVSEMPDFGGVSVTNGIEVIGLEISRCYGLNPRHTVLIEHYDDRERGAAARFPGRTNGEKFSCVTFGELKPLPSDNGASNHGASHNGKLNGEWSLRRPQWRVLGKPEVEMLLGCALP